MSNQPIPIVFVQLVHEGLVLLTHNTRCCPYPIPRKKSKIIVKGICYTVNSIDYSAKTKTAKVNLI